MSHRLRNKRRNSLGLIAHTNPKSSISEQYKLIRTNIEFASIDKQIKSIVVTSAAPADGKTTTAANLAVVLAQQGKQVLLVDADLRRPSLHYMFQLDNLEGLTSVLTEKVSLKKAISKTQVLNLNVLTSGPIPPNPSELLSSLKMETILREMNNIYDYILVDTPPVLAAADAQVASNSCDGILMVVASERTNKGEAVKATKLLRNTKASLLGVVLNEVKFKDNMYNYVYE
ncbi:CpsD/CapB family tyrosine-protein kinase (plasmid) [Bacillus megaterium]|nr:CpsD/CapB family tyrosine-protein kinase [Priestia megaterium]